jgi:short-subunit dehydrogenase
MLDVNVVALCLCTQLSVKSMVQVSGGCDGNSRSLTSTTLQHKIDDGQVILVSSFSGHRVVNSPPTRFYAATKFAVRALLEGWRQEVRDKGDIVPRRR